MDQSINQPVEIDLKDLFCYILKKLTVIILVAAICAVALMSYAWLKNRNAGDVMVTNVLDLEERLPGESDDEYNNRSTKVLQARNVMESIEALSNQVEIQNRYVADSIFMRLDPFNIPESNSQVVISLAGDQQEGSLEAIYTAYRFDILNGSYLDGAAEALGCTRDSIAELISVSKSLEDNTIVDDNQIIVFNIKVVGVDTEFTFALTDLILTEIESVSSDISDTVADHAVSLSGRQNGICNDSDVRKKQFDVINTINNLQSQINSQNTILDNIGKQLGITDRNAFYDPSSVDSASSSIKSIIKFGVIGFALGVIIVVAFYALNYIWGRKIVSQTQFFLLFGELNKIGVCKPGGKRSSFSSFLDRITEDDNHLSQDNSDKLIVANLGNLTSATTKIIVTGTVASDIVKNKIKDLKLSGDVKLDIFESPDILKDVSSYDGIVLVEQRGVSEKKKIREQLRLLKNSGKRIIGAIVV